MKMEKTDIIKNSVRININSGIDNQQIPPPPPFSSEN
jgi:hypothetical protein